MVVCCECAIPLSKPTAKYCPSGHRQFEENRRPEPAAARPDVLGRQDPIGNQDRHPDDDEIVSSSVDQWRSAASGRARSVSRPVVSSRPSISSQLGATVGEANALRSKAINRDTERRRFDQSKGSYGVRPANESTIKRSMTIWLCERPPIRAQQLGVPVSKNLELQTSLATPDDVDRLIRDIVSRHPAYIDHQEISSGDLSPDVSRKAYFGRVDSGNVPTFLEIWEEEEGATVKTLIKLFGPNQHICLCVPVERREKRPVGDISSDNDGDTMLRPSRQSQKRRVKNDDKVAKRPRSGTRIIANDEEVKIELRSKSELEVKRETEVKNEPEVEAKEDGIETDAGSGIDDDIDLPDPDKILEGIYSVVGTRTKKKPLRYGE